MTPASPRVGAAAPAAAMLRAAQKDSTFRSLLQAAVADLVHGTIGGVFWIRHHASLSTATDLVYAALTTLSLRQTLGEEYAGILQVNGSCTALPSGASRHAMVYLQCLGPTLLQVLVRRLEASLQQGGALQSYLRPQLTEVCRQHLLPAVKSSVTGLQRLHLALFYSQGLFYHISKRLTGVRYVSVRRWLTSHSSSGSLRLLGRLTLLQLCLQLLLALRRLHAGVCAERQEEEAQATPDAYVPPSLQCPLCLCERHQPALCRCGHVFCYACLHTALATAGHHCPICRFPMEPRQVVPLVNFR